MAFAEAVNLGPADLPGFGVAPAEPGSSAAQPRLERAMLECVGIFDDQEELASSYSKEFERNVSGVDLGASSSVSVARTPAIAAQGLVPHSPQARTCLSHYLAQHVERNPKGGSSIHSLSATPERALAPGTSGGVVLRVLANITLAGERTPLNLDFYGFVCGQAQIGLFTTSLPGAFPAQTRQQLLALLLARAKARGQCVTSSRGASASRA